MSHFLKELLSKPLEIGAICPSSKHLAKAMTSPVVASSRCIVELGPGTGRITSHILEEKNADSIFFALEINPTFVKIVEEKYPGTSVYLDSATNIQKYLQKHQQEHCDLIISSLPWTWFNNQTQTEIFTAINHSLSEQGKLVTCSYLHTLPISSGRKFKRLLKEHFSIVEKKIVWKNVPPAIVYECTR